MKRCYTRLCVRASTAMVLLFSTIASVSGDSLEEGFRDPPRQYSMVPLWSWNGRLQPEQLRWQIDQMVDKGVYGAFMHARAGINLDETPYFSARWWEGVKASVEHGTRVGFATWIYDEDKWPSGSAGGRTAKANPTRNTQKVLRIVERRVTGPREVAVSIPDARYVIAGRCTQDNQLAPDSLVDVSGFNSLPEDGGQAEAWSCPDGDWLLSGYVFEPHEGVNYLNKATVRDFIDITHEEYARRFGQHFGKTILGVFFDEIQNDAGKESDNIVWAEGFEERFRAMKGYDLRRFLPTLTADIGRTTAKIRCDYCDVYTTLYEEAWFEQIADWCASHNLELTGHTVGELNRYTTQGNYIRTLRHLQIPTTDNEDFRYTWPREIGSWKPKQAASIAHLYGRARVGAEAMGGAGWSFTLDSARYGFNMLAAHGVNFFIPHLFHYAQDRPANVDDWPNSWFFRNPLTLQDQVIVALRRITRAIDLHSRLLLQRYGLTAPQLTTLQAVGHLQPVTVGRIARSVHLSQATITGILNRLDKRGLVTRARGDHDRRSVVVRQTDAGRELAAAAPSLLQDRFHRELTKLHEWEQTMILATLQRIASMMDAETIAAAPMLVPGSATAPEEAVARYLEGPTTP